MYDVSNNYNKNKYYYYHLKFLRIINKYNIRNQLFYDELQ